MAKMRELSFAYYTPDSEEKMYELHDGIIKLLNKLNIDSVGVISDMPYTDV